VGREAFVSLDLPPNTPAANNAVGGGETENVPGSSPLGPLLFLCAAAAVAYWVYACRGVRAGGGGGYQGIRTGAGGREESAELVSVSLGGEAPESMRF